MYFQYSYIYSSNKCFESLYYSVFSSIWNLLGHALVSSETICYLFLRRYTVKLCNVQISVGSNEVYQSTFVTEDVLLWNWWKDWWKFRHGVIPLPAIRSQQIFAHATTAQLACHVQNFVAITVLQCRWEWIIEFDLRWKNRSCNGAQVWQRTFCSTPLKEVPKRPIMLNHY